MDAIEVGCWVFLCHYNAADETHLDKYPSMKEFFGTWGTVSEVDPSGGDVYFRLRDSTFWFHSSWVIAVRGVRDAPKSVGGHEKTQHRDIRLIRLRRIG